MYILFLLINTYGKKFSFSFAINYNKYLNINFLTKSIVVVALAGWLAGWLQLIKNSD